ncbi:hypothetical protein FRX31_023441 [Thalictrum thalictroides]|uniref:Uncharacterized protein n=1 Tax=Thalictrum thalictroides TaxID=46969 RepID=A0A7J6VRH1_THATH|nr:hypothetical protein FRX31_023441 [Thalictrum thalictroides]
MFLGQERTGQGNNVQGRGGARQVDKPRFFVQAEQGFCRSFIPIPALYRSGERRTGHHIHKPSVY